MYATEALLYAAPSTLNDSGIGLFLHPRLRKISAGSYLCTYATSWSSYQPSEEDGSYVLEVAVNGHTRFYDATSYDGANIGRFANENGVLEALKDVKRRSDKKKFTNFHESEWKKVNDDLAQKANACFKVHGNELHLIAKVDIQPSKTPIEIFTSYGDIRSFWIAGIVRHPENYPANMVKIVKSLFNSHRSNWTIEQKQRWGNCEDLLDENNKVCTFSEVLI
ncbi:uncharacterized protein LOC114532838 [Dendronephthya gigantea]|uniref:uncharacterized protein LOC114532838 n=1 Tax=Dendronephthya gigantea TaxID=151771 RepID=UPI00106A845D|nr:uncharacterized protein LOC114532838 [Dendronephthya gigantea]